MMNYDQAAVHRNVLLFSLFLKHKALQIKLRNF